MGDVARNLELDAYKAVMRALYANPVYNSDMSRGIKRDLLLSQLRAELKVTDDENMEFLSQVLDDNEVMQLNKGKAVSGGLKKRPAPIPNAGGGEKATPASDRGGDRAERGGGGSASAQAPSRAPPRERDREKERERREERERNRAAAAAQGGLGGGGGGRSRKSDMEREAEKEEARRDPFFARRVRRFFEGKWLDCVVVHYKKGMGHCIASNHRKQRETWEWVDLHGTYDPNLFIVTEEFEKDVVAGDPNDRLRSKTYSFSVAGNKGGNADNFTNRLREAGRSEQATEMLLTETTAHSTRIRAQLEVIRLIEHCATREEAERVLVERMNELTHRGNALRTEIDRVKAAEEAGVLPSNTPPVDPRQPPAPAMANPPLSPPPPTNDVHLDVNNAVVKQEAHVKAEGPEGSMQAPTDPAVFGVERTPGAGTTTGGGASEVVVEDDMRME